METIKKKKIPKLAERTRRQRRGTVRALRAFRGAARSGRLGEGAHLEAPRERPAAGRGRHSAAQAGGRARSGEARGGAVGGGSLRSPGASRLPRRRPRGGGFSYLAARRLRQVYGSWTPLPVICKRRSALGC